MLSTIAIAFGFVLIMSLHKHHCWHIYYPGHYTHYTNSVYALVHVLIFQTSEKMQLTSF